MSVSEAFRGVVDESVASMASAPAAIGSTWSRAAEYKPATRGSAIQFNGHVGLD
jgi:hypothetical protein